jgi:hypothetical protein
VRGPSFGSGQYALGRTWGCDADQRLASVSNAAGGPEVARHNMAYDPVGNITQRTTKLGTNNFRECFTYATAISRSNATGSSRSGWEV